MRSRKTAAPLLALAAVLWTLPCFGEEPNAGAATDGGAMLPQVERGAEPPPGLSDEDREVVENIELLEELDTVEDLELLLELSSEQ